MIKTGILFSGQGAQHVGMGHDLYQSSDTAKQIFELGIQPLGSSFLDICFQGPEETLTETRYCQPALYLHGIALLEVLREKNPSFQFQATAGLSLGEFTAHAAAGTFSIAEGLSLVAERGRLMQEACDANQGGMLALIGADEALATEIAAASGLEVANLNSPGQVVLSGSTELVSPAVELSKAKGVKKAVPLQVAGAYHSSLMATAQEGLKSTLADVQMNESNTDIYSNVTGKKVAGSEEITSTLITQVTGSVRWQDCIQNMIADGVEQFIELGPGGVLAGMCKRINRQVPCRSISNLNDLETFHHDS
ncbi:MAG: ACP S-malonyltransferase [Verrucomicrobiota bacterium]